ncbi:heat-inducible transcriptional repressor HrcA [Mycoplasmopsis verecunda]|uniref:Heat-inducible transcription repressor HrcA n=1 Tax=Mycoplasmopsis verecunda TaxID=171291 RepID=A0A1T4L1M7_9BACT|nr:heat-inducible transcriptional repressor HrcA [Mycoplasmopsis verecunda]WPB54381.1 heat-inducible transcriptional repressor HrcA [Mycoplasmopsis verecunda]SJZ48615.1 heat-inducible transcription repressor HrcA [Mycoplasmopsis verecunda]
MKTLQKLSDKYEPVLKYTVQTYIETGEPVSSSQLLNKYGSSHPEVNFSSAKMRYIMSDLEEMGYLKKEAHTSGRIPTLDGLNYYAKYLSSTVSTRFEDKLNAILANKNTSIDNTVDQAAQIIADMTGLTMVTTESDQNDMELKSIELVALSDTKATIVMVISSGEVFSKILNISDKSFKMNDVRIAIKIFKERLINTPLNEIPARLLLLKDVLAESVKKYQELINSFVEDVFHNIGIRTKGRNNVYGKNNIILSPKIDRNNLNKMIELIENHSVWESIEAEIDEDEKIKIMIDESGTYMSKKIETGDKVTEISVVGATNSNYDMMRSAIKILDNYLNRKKED